MKAADIMTGEVAICRTTDNLNRAAQLMWEGRYGCIPVLDEWDAVAGMLTDRDVCMASYTQGKPLSQISVTTAMAGAVVTCHPSTTIDGVRDLMAVHRLRRIPVVDDQGRLLGLVSLTDIARAAALWDGRSEIDLEAVAMTFAEVSGRPGELLDRNEQPTQLVREAILNSVDLLKTLRQEIRADIKLASNELRRRWKRLEARLHTAEARARAARSESAESLESLVDGAKRFHSALNKPTSRVA